MLNYYVVVWLVGVNWIVFEGSCEECDKFGYYELGCEYDWFCMSSREKLELGEVWFGK
jgi:hypothetical protein